MRMDELSSRTEPMDVPPYFAVVRRGYSDTFETLRRFNEQDLVQVMWDRRAAERRTSHRPVAMERRARPRRSPPPGTWDRLGFVLAPWLGP